MALSLSFDETKHGKLTDSSSYSWSDTRYETYEDGTLVTRYSDGGMNIYHTDGSTISINADGTGYAWSSDWSEFLSVSDYSTYHSYPDGSRISSYDDGSGSIKDSDGNTVYLQAGGEPYSWSNTLSDLNQDCLALTDTGSDVGFVPTEITYPHVETLRDGSEKVSEEDGSFKIDHTDGSIEIQDAEGNNTLTQIDGSYVSKPIDGSVKSVEADGTYTLDYGNGRVDSVDKNGEGFTEITLNQRTLNDPDNEGDFESNYQEVTVKIGLGEKFGEGLGKPDVYYKDTWVEYDGVRYLIDDDLLDKSWTDDFPNGENIQSLSLNYKGESVVGYDNDPLLDSITYSENGSQFIDYADGVQLDTLLGTDKGKPESYSVKDDVVTIQYADGSGFKTESSNVDMPWLSDLPEGVLSFRPSWNEGDTYILFNEDADMDLMILHGDGSKAVTFKEGVTIDPPLIFENVSNYRVDGETAHIELADGSRYELDKEGLDLSFLSGYPEPENVFTFDSGGVWYNSESDIHYISVKESTDDVVGSVTVNFKDNSFETESADGSYEFTNSDGISYYRDAQGNTRVEKVDEDSGKSLSHSSDADGGWSINIGGPATVSYRIADENSAFAKGDASLSATPLDYEGFYGQESTMLNIQHADGSYIFTQTDGSQVYHLGGDTIVTTNEAAKVFTHADGSHSLDPTPNTTLSMDDIEIWKQGGNIIDVNHGIISNPEDAKFFEGDTGFGGILTMDMEVLPNPADSVMGDYPEGYGDVTINDDGSETLLRSDGYEFTWFQDGHMEGVGPTLNSIATGSQSYFPDATGNEVSYQYEYPDLADKGFGLDAQFTKYADGSASYSDGDHQVSWPQYPPQVGTEISFQMADGSYGKEVITRLNETGGLSEGEVSHSITAIFMPGNDVPMMSTKNDGEFTEDGYSMFSEYTSYTLNEDGSFDTLSGLHITVEKPDNLAQPPTMPDIEEPSFDFETDIEPPGVLFSHSFYGNDDLKLAVESDINERETSAQQATEDVYTETRYENAVEDIVIQNDDGSETRISEVDDTTITFTKYADGSSESYSSTGHYSFHRIDEENPGFTINELSYFSEPSDHAGSFDTITESGTKISYSHTSTDEDDVGMDLSAFSLFGGSSASNSDLPSYSVEYPDGSKIEFTDRYGWIETDDGQGNSTSYASNPWVSYNLADGSNYAVDLEGNIFGASDSKGYDSQAYLDDNGDIQVIQTSTTTIDGIISVVVDTEGKELITHIDDYQIPGLAEKEAIQQLVMDAAPDVLIKYLVDFGPEAMTNGLSDRHEAIQQAEQDKEQAEVNAEAEVRAEETEAAEAAGVMYSQEWYDSAKVAINDNGSTTTSYADGSVETRGENWTPYSFKGADGSESISNEDGSGYWSDGQGNTSTWNADMSSSWSNSDGTSGTYNADGTSSTTLKDGSVETYDMMGQLTGKLDADGNQKALVTPEPGVYTQDDGSIETWYQDGSHSVESTWGSTETYATDGTYTYESDGYKSVSYPDGSGESSSDYGYNSTWDASGNSSWEDTNTGQSGYSYNFDDGAYLSVNSDGSMSGGNAEYSWWEQDTSGNVTAYDNNWNSITLDEPPFSFEDLGIDDPYAEISTGWGDSSNTAGTDNFGIAPMNTSSNDNTPPEDALMTATDQSQNNGAPEDASLNDMEQVLSNEAANKSEDSPSDDYLNTVDELDPNDTEQDPNSMI